MRIMKSLLAGAAFAVGMFVVAAVAVLPLPGTNGPFLGDAITNLYTLTQSYTFQINQTFSPNFASGPAATQSTCANIVNSMTQITTNAATGSICLPPAFGGRDVMIFNGSGNSLNIYSSNTPFTPGTPDTINGAAAGQGSAYAGNTGGAAAKTTTCFSANNGAWHCITGA